MTTKLLTDEEWIEMSQQDFVAKMVTLGVKYRQGLFPDGAWKQEGSVLNAYLGSKSSGRVLVGQYDSATGKGRSMYHAAASTLAACPA